MKPVKMLMISTLVTLFVFSATSCSGSYSTRGKVQKKMNLDSDFYDSSTNKAFLGFIINSKENQLDPVMEKEYTFRNFNHEKDAELIQKYIFAEDLERKWADEFSSFAGVTLTYVDDIAEQLEDREKSDLIQKFKEMIHSATDYKIFTGAYVINDDKIDKKLVKAICNEIDADYLLASQLMVYPSYFYYTQYLGTHHYFNTQTNMMTLLFDSNGDLILNGGNKNQSKIFTKSAFLFSSWDASRLILKDKVRHIRADGVLNSPIILGDLIDNNSELTAKGLQVEGDSESTIETSIESTPPLLLINEGDLYFVDAKNNLNVSISLHSTSGAQIYSDEGSGQHHPKVPRTVDIFIIPYDTMSGLSDEEYVLKIIREGEADAEYRLLMPAFTWPAANLKK